MSKLTHVLLPDGTIIFQLPAGSHFVTPLSFNYRKIYRNLPISEEDLLPLLKTPLLPDGIFYLYQHDDTISYHQISNTTNNRFILKDGKFRSYSTNDQNYQKHIGVYASLTDIINDYPEYFL